MSYTFALLFLSLFIAPFGYAQSDEVDHLHLASMLVKNGHYARARAEIEKVKKEQRKDEATVYYTTKGLIELNAKDFKLASGAFEKAYRSVRKDEDLQETQKKKKLAALGLYLVQCQFGLENYNEVIKRINAGSELLSLNLAWTLKTASLWKLDKKHEAWSVLEEAEQRFASDSNFSMQKVNYLLELKLYHEAFVEAKRLTSNHKLRAVDWLRLGGQFKQIKKYDEALWFFETGVLSFPAAELLSVELAHTYTLKNMPLSAAYIFEKLATRKPKYYSDVAELYRQKGKLLRAEYFNAMVEDQKKKLRQRFSLALGQKQFTKAVAMQPALSRAGLFEDQNLVYAMAFTQYSIGALNPAKKLLSKITNAELFEKVVALRSTIGECEEKPWECE